ncbi:MAG: 4Fe-4S dicluster domain-containing protein [Bacteroidales bacterium]|nr:4Fe-4S dicluster domain-containing protein [Bacteroidales bacterium]
MSKSEEYDVLVIGGGISGEEAALNLAHQGHKIVLVEKDLSLGGKMIHLSKVFPTLDCAACITTPKVSETARHPNITIYTFSEVSNIDKKSKYDFRALLTKHPRYVIEESCTGCQLCEEACPVTVQDQYQYDLVGRKAVYVPFSIANPRIAAIDIENCSLCGACEKACPADCIDFTQEKEEIQIKVKSVIVATGYKLFDPLLIPRYGFGMYKNLITSMQMERQLVPTRPFNNVLRPKDGKVPDNIAYVLCAGSRDETVGNPICSQVCCMYSVKQAQLLMGALPMADVTIYYLHIRSFGKGFNEFYQQSKDMGVNFIKGKIGTIKESENGDLKLRYEDIESGVVKEVEHDMVVLSVGILANDGISSMFKTKLKLDEFNYVDQKDLLANPAQTNIEGVYVAGTASGPMDIPDSILSAGAASAEIAGFLMEGNNHEK